MNFILYLVLNKKKQKHHLHRSTHIHYDMELIQIHLILHSKCCLEKKSFMKSKLVLR